MSKGPYSRIYLSIIDDPMFEKVFNNDHALATWLRLLLVADAMWPVSAPMTTRNPTVLMLIRVGLVLEKPGHRYSMRGLEAERERRSHAGRNAAAMRWQSGSNALRNAEAMPRQDETSKDETSNGDAPASTFMRFRPKKEPGMLADAYRHEGQHADCAVCAAIAKP